MRARLDEPTPIEPEFREGTIVTVSRYKGMNADAEPHSGCIRLGNRPVQVLGQTVNQLGTTRALKGMNNTARLALFGLGNLLTAEGQGRWAQTVRGPPEGPFSPQRPRRSQLGGRREMAPKAGVLPRSSGMKSPHHSCSECRASVDVKPPGKSPGPLTAGSGRRCGLLDELHRLALTLGAYRGSSPGPRPDRKSTAPR